MQHPYDLMMHEQKYDSSSLCISMVVALCNCSVAVGAAPPFGATPSRQNSTQGLGSCRQLLGFYRRRFWGLATNACSNTILYYSGWPFALKLTYSNFASSFMKNAPSHKGSCFATLQKMVFEHAHLSSCHNLRAPHGQSLQ